MLDHTWSLQPERPACHGVGPRTTCSGLPAAERNLHPEITATSHVSLLTWGCNLHQALRWVHMFADTVLGTRTVRIYLVLGVTNLVPSSKTHSLFCPTPQKMADWGFLFVCFFLPFVYLRGRKKRHRILNHSPKYL